ncbi:MAG: thioesterase domain-containing protein, partial [Legionellaceae bacterium]|nr:thioesterase domain-containing protein [Legionellaceae bacterium]
NPKLHDKFASSFKVHLIQVIQHCATQLNEGVKQYTPSDLPDFIPYEKINFELNEDPVFIFPPGHAGAECYYHNIVTGLSDKKMVVFNNFYHELNEVYGPRANQYLRYEALASYYIQQMKRIQKQGPYRLFGWSFGGVLAVEILNQLNAIGDVVSDVILMDAHFNHKKAVKSVCVRHQLKLPEKMLFEINYNYQPNKIRCMKTNIILFKALHAPSERAVGLDGFDVKIFSHYVNSTEDNHLSDICDASIEIIPMQASHDNWVKKPEIVNQICSVIKGEIASVVRV